MKWISPIADDVKVLANDPDGEVLVHLGSSDYLDRYKIYVAHVREWRQQFTKLESVDLRYDRQIVVNPDMPGAKKPAPLSLHAAKLAMAAGVKPASLISHETIPLKMPSSVPAATVSGKPPVRVVANKPAVSKPAANKPVANHVAASKPVAKKKVVRAAHGKASWKKTHAKTVAASVKKPAPKPAAKPVTVPAQRPSAKTNSVASAQPAIDPSKKKPSPAIAKSQENP